MAEITTIARPYAQAVFELAQEQAALKEWSQTLELLAMIVGDPQMTALIDSPDVSKSARSQLIADICGERLPEAGRNFLEILSDNNRLAALPEIAALYEVARAQAESRITAEVVSATPLSATQCEALVAALKKRLGREVELDCSIDETLLGGAIVRAGDMVIDGSVTGRLDKLGAALLR